jgi:hypothetical protein
LFPFFLDTQRIGNKRRRQHYEGRTI